MLTILPLSIIPLLWLAFTTNTFAAVSLGEASNNILSPLSGLNHVIYKICYILGAALICGAIIQYKAYRDNPTHVNLHQSVLLLIFGIAIVALPFIVGISAGAISLNNIH